MTLLMTSSPARHWTARPQVLGNSAGLSESNTAKRTTRWTHQGVGRPWMVTGDDHDELRRAARFWLTTTVVLRRSSAEGNQRTGFALALWCRGKQRRRLASTELTARIGRIGGVDRIHVDEGLPAGYGEKEPVAGLLLLLANPTTATATEGDVGRQRTERMEIKTQWESTGSRQRATSGGTRHKRTGGRGGDLHCSPGGGDGDQRRRLLGGAARMEQRPTLGERRRLRGETARARELELGVGNEKGGLAGSIYIRKRERSAQTREDLVADWLRFTGLEIRFIWLIWSRIKGIKSYSLEMKQKRKIGGIFPLN